MKSVNKIQIAVIAGSLLLVVLLLLLNTKLPQKKEQDSHTTETAVKDVQQIVKEIVASMDETQKKEFEKLEKELASNTNKQKTVEDIIHFFDSARQPIASAYYMEQAASAVPTDSNWTYAGARYYSAIQFSKPESHSMLYQKAIKCFEKTIEINPNNTDAKISLAACYVEGSTDPMKGIGMLREIEKTDSNNVNLQLNFAFFSERSGQWDKAIARFEKILKIKPDFIEAYLHLADAYQQKGDKANAIENLKQYMNKVDDATIKAEVQNYINKLSQ